MIIDTDTKEGKALVALAKFGAYMIETCALWDEYRETAAELGLVKVRPNGWYDDTDLAKLPEGL